MSLSDQQRQAVRIFFPGGKDAEFESEMGLETEEQPVQAAVALLRELAEEERLTKRRARRIAQAKFPNCATCRFFVYIKETLSGSCQRFPATVAKHEMDWCGEHKPF